MTLGWPIKTLGDVCGFVRGPFGGSLKKSIFVRDGFAVYEQQHAIYNQFEEIRYFIDDAKFEEMRRFELLPNDLIMSCSGTMGKVAIVPESIRRGIINQALLKLTPSNGVSPEFLKYWMDSTDFQDSLKEQSGGAAIQNVASVIIEVIDDAPPGPSLMQDDQQPPDGQEVIACKFTDGGKSLGRGIIFYTSPRMGKSQLSPKVLRKIDLKEYTLPKLREELTSPRLGSIVEIRPGMPINIQVKAKEFKGVTATKEQAGKYVITGSDNNLGMQPEMNGTSCQRGGEWLYAGRLIGTDKVGQTQIISDFVWTTETPPHSKGLDNGSGNWRVCENVGSEFR